MSLSAGGSSETAPSAPSLPSALLSPNTSLDMDTIEWEKHMFEAYLKLLHIANLKVAGGGEGLAGANVPRMALVGLESQGKSSLLQKFLGFPCAFINKKTGTRCPVQYTLRQSDGVKDYVVTIDGRPCEPKDLAATIQNHMSNVESKKLRFDKAVVNVEVVHKDYINIVLLDLPGIRVNPEKDHEDEKVLIDQLVRSYIQQRDHFLLLVGRCMAVNSDALIREVNRLLDNLRPDWTSHYLYIATHFDLEISALGTTDLANDFYNNSLHHQNSLKFKYCVGIPDFPTGMNDFEERKKYLGDLEKMEEWRFEEWMKEIDPTKEGPGPDGWRSTFGKLDAEFRNHLGIENARNAIKKRFYELIAQEAQKWMIPLQKDLELQEAEIKKLKGLLDTLGNGQQLLVDFHAVVRKFVTMLKDVFMNTGEVGNVLENSWLFEDEIRKSMEFDRNAQPFRPDWVDVLKALQAQAPKGKGDLGEEIEMPYTGSKQIERALKIHKYLVLSFPTTDWNNIKLQKPFLGYLVGSITKPDFNKAVRDMVYTDLTTNLVGQEQSTNLGGVSLRWLFDHVVFILAYNGALTLDHVLKNKPELSYLRKTPFQGYLVKKYYEVVKKLTNMARTQFLTIVENHIRYLVHDRLSEVERIMKAVPRAKIVEKENASHANSKGAKSQFPASSGATTVPAASPVSDSANEIPPEYDLTQVDVEGPGIPVGLFELASTEPARTELARKKRPGLNYKTITKLCSRDPVGTPNNPSTAQVASWVTEGYYSQLMFLLVELEHCVNQCIVSEVQQNTGFRETIRDDLEKAVSGITEVEAVELRKFNIQEAKKDLQDHEIQREHLSIAITVLKDALQCLPSTSQGFFSGF